MKTARLALLASAVTSLTVGAVVAVSGCAATGHPTTPTTFGAARPSSALEAVIDEPGPITVETVVAADWEVPRSGLIDLDDPRARAAHLVDGSEPIHIYLHAIHHPTRGLFLVDTGVERAFVADPGHAVVRGIFGSLAHLDRLHVHTDTASFIARQTEPVQGVLLTHLHLDHVMGMRDVPSSVPVYVGAGDARAHDFMNLFERGVYDEALEGKGPLREVSFEPDPDGAFRGIADVFGDRSLWAIWVPGHTAGSIAFLARTPAGPVLLAGDACHTAWGWQHGVAPGSFSENRVEGADSLARLQRLVQRHPGIDVRLGHQELPRPTAAR